MLKRTLVYSTRPHIHDKMCKISGRRNRLNTTIVSSARVGRSPEAMIVCERINQAAKTSLFIGQFKAATHRNRRKKSMHLPTLRQMQHKLST